MSKSNNFQPKISIITVVYNAFEFIEATIQSVINQTYPNIEYIIIDGRSSDGTLEVILKYKPNLSFFSSEPDQGIYDAMNKGLSVSTGDYILFLNAGDKLSDNTSISKIFQREKADIYYGKVSLIDSKGVILGERKLKPPEVLTWKSFRWGMLVSHQAFIPKRILTQNFSLNYKISSDIDWCINCIKKAKLITNTHQTITQYLVGGKSRKNTILSWKERFLIMHKHYGLLPTFGFHFLIIFRFLGYFLISGKLD